MPLFTLPLSAANGDISSQHANTRPTESNIGRKRKRAPSPSEPAPERSYEVDPSGSGPTAYISNPLSLNDAERAQYLLAGLPLDAELPSKTYTSFPYQALPEDVYLTNTGWTTAADDTGVQKKVPRQSQGSRLKLQHLGVLTTIVQRCLQEGDIKRATTAWALLLRAQIGGRPVDLRAANYWGIGAELLIRGGEERSFGRKPLASVSSTFPEPDEHEEGTSTPQKGSEDIRWGTKAGIRKARAYYERLILQHPYLRQFSATSISAIDFWPAMLSCEIYGIQHEHLSSLATLSLNSQAEEEEEDEMGEHESDISTDEDNTNDEDHDHDKRAEKQSSKHAEKADRREARMEARKAARRSGKLYDRKEDARLRALEAASGIANRMDELMTGPPWTDSGVLLRLRGCVALWMGDLNVPTPWKGEKEHSRESREEMERNVKSGKEFRRGLRLLAKQDFLRAEQRGTSCPELDLDEDRDEEDEDEEMSY